MGEKFGAEIKSVQLQLVLLPLSLSLFLTL